MYKLLGAFLLAFTVSLITGDTTTTEKPWELDDLNTSYTADTFERDFPSWTKDVQDNGHIAFSRSNGHAKEIVDFYPNGTFASITSLLPIINGALKCNTDEEEVDGNCTPVLG